MRPSPLRCLAAGLSLSLALAAITRTTTHAQDPTTTSPPVLSGAITPPGRQSLLLQESVQADLDLTDKQKSQINSLQAALGQKRREAFQMAQENGAEPQEFAEAMIAVDQQHQASLVRVLDKTQKARLAQIELQREGFLASTRSDIASKLKLTGAQTKKIKTIAEEMRREVAQSMPGMLGGLQPGAAPQPKAAGSSKSSKKGSSKSRRPATEGSGGAAAGGTDEMIAEGQFDLGNGGFFPAGPPGGLPDFLKNQAQADMTKFQEASKKSRAAANTKIGEVLTADQKTAFEKLTGEPFDFSKIQATPTEVKADGVAEPKADDSMKKEETPKAQPKTKSRKSANQ